MCSPGALSDRLTSEELAPHTAAPLVLQRDEINTEGWGLQEMGEDGGGEKGKGVQETGGVANLIFPALA